jgi:DNA-binding NarL/FixJ family response regulator
MQVARRDPLENILERYRARVREFDEIAARRSGPADPSPAIEHIQLGQAPTPRELDVLRLVAEGYSNKQIAASLVLAEDTVKSHVRSLLVKLQARNRAHAVALGLDRGLIDLRSADAA